MRMFVVQSLSHILRTSNKNQSYRDIKKIISKYCEVIHQQIGQPRRNENFEKRITWKTESKRNRQFEQTDHQ